MLHVFKKAVALHRAFTVGSSKLLMLLSGPTEMESHLNAYPREVDDQTPPCHHAAHENPLSQHTASRSILADRNHKEPSANPTLAPSGPGRRGCASGASPRPTAGTETQHPARFPLDMLVLDGILDTCRGYMRC